RWQRLRPRDGGEYLPKLREFAKTAPDAETGFGGNIMDPRVGTRFPGSVKVACEQLVDEWEEPAKAARENKSDRKEIRERRKSCRRGWSPSAHIRGSVSAVGGLVQSPVCTAALTAIPSTPVFHPSG